MRIVRSCGADTIAACLRITRQESNLATMSDDRPDISLSPEEFEKEDLESFAASQAISTNE